MLLTFNSHYNSNKIIILVKENEKACKAAMDYGEIEFMLVYANWIYTSLC